MRFVFLLNGMTGYLDAQYRQLHARGHEIMIVAPRDPASFEAMADTAFELRSEEYARVVDLDLSADPAILVAAVESFDPDAVAMTSWNFADAYRAVMKAVRQDVVRILIMDNLWRAAPRQWLGRLTHRWYVDPVADVAMVPSDRTEFYARRLGFGPDDIIRGSLSADVAVFDQGARSGADLAGHHRFLYVGRLVEHKGADVLGAAYRRYRELTPKPWDLDVVGMGPLEPLLREIPGVTLHGFRQPAEVAALMATSSCLALTSHIEPYGVVVHEATCAGLPLLCTDFAGAVPGLVQDGYNGWLVPTGDTEAWARAMVRMSSVGPERLGTMSAVSHALSTRISPAGWALNLEEQVARRRPHDGGRIATA